MMKSSLVLINLLFFFAGFSASPAAERQVWRLEFKEYPKLESGKLCALKGRIETSGDHYLIDQLAVSQPIHVTLIAENTEEILRLEVFKHDWQTPIESTSTQEKGTCTLKFRTHSEVNLRVSGEKEKTPYRLIAWVGPEFNYPITSPFISMEEYKKEQKKESFGNLFLSIISFVGIVLLAIFAFLFFINRKKSPIKLAIILFFLGSFSILSSSAEPINYYNPPILGPPLPATPPKDPVIHHHPDAEQVGGISNSQPYKPDDPRNNPPNSLPEGTPKDPVIHHHPDAEQVGGTSNSQPYKPDDPRNDPPKLPNGNSKDTKAINDIIDSSRKDQSENKDDFDMLTPEDSHYEPNYKPTNTPKIPTACLDNPDCQKCFTAAYDKLNFVRKNLEKLRIIGTATSDDVKRAISFGDSVSPIHGVSGLAWQAEKRKIEQSLEKLKKTYDKKYQGMMKSLHHALLEISKCEAKYSGNPDWYNQYGFIYYTFMEDLYRRKF